jgi:hypothetical protein
VRSKLATGSSGARCTNSGDTGCTSPPLRSSVASAAFSVARSFAVFWPRARPCRGPRWPAGAGRGWRSPRVRASRVGQVAVEAVAHIAAHVHRLLGRRWPK